MKSKRAISILNSSQERLGNVTDAEFNPWRIQLLSHLTAFFGPESPEVIHVKSAGLSAYEGGHVADPLPRAVNAYKIFIDRCKETLHERGLFKKENLLRRLSNEALLGTIIGVLAGAFGLGTLWGKFLSDTQNFELKQKVEKFEKASEVFNQKKNQSTAFAKRNTDNN